MTSDYVRREFMKSAFDAYSKMQDAVQSGLTSVRSAALSPLEAVSGLVQGMAPENAMKPAMCRNSASVWRNWKRA